MLQLWGYFLLTIAGAFLLTPLIRRLAQRLKIYARHSDRTLHQGLIPKLGGAAILLPFYFFSALLMFTNRQVFAGYFPMFITLLAGSFILFLLGALDDKYDINCYIKITVEVLIAALAVNAGWRIDTLVLPAALQLQLGALSWPLSILWITGIINAVNLIDGLDGLAPGIIIIVSLTSAAIASVLGNMPIVLLPCCWPARRWDFCVLISIPPVSLWATPAVFLWVFYWHV